MRFLLITLLTFSIVIGGCKGGKQTAVSNEKAKKVQEVKEIRDSAGQVDVEKQRPTPPGPSTNLSDMGGVGEVSGCMVSATILSIESKRDTAFPERPCGKYPCYALIRIDQILKMGQLCAPVVAPGLELMAYFKFTLQKTEELFPDMRRHFPGLEKSDTFTTSFVTFLDNDGQYKAVINGYSKTE